MISLQTIETQLDAWNARDEDVLGQADFLLGHAEQTMENWLVAHDREPTLDQKEGSRLLALHRQSAKGDPSFNACRETCRELVYRYNMVHSEPDAVETRQRLEMMRRLAHHLVLFNSGKLQNAGLGEFCCSSKPLRQVPQEQADLN